MFHCRIIVVLLITIYLTYSIGKDEVFVLFTPNQRIDVTSKNFDQLNISKPVVLITHGFLSDISLDIFLLNITKTYQNLNDRNVIFLDWGVTAFGNYAQLVLQGVPRVGKLLGDYLLQLNDLGFDFANIHLIGQSLGAHVSGHAGRYVQEKRPKANKIQRITGLDPAGPLYEKVFGVLPNPLSLRPTDAKIVDCMHTDSGFLGTINRIGTVDFLINGGINQQFCRDFNFSFPFIIENICNHEFSSILYQVTIGQKDYKASANPDVCQDSVVYGDLFDGNATGLFYATTQSTWPYKSLC